MTPKQLAMQTQKREIAIFEAALSLQKRGLIKSVQGRPGAFAVTASKGSKDMPIFAFCKKFAD